MSTQFVRVPPDSTGKKIKHMGGVDLKLTSILTNTRDFKRGSIITGVTSSATAKITGWTNYYGDTYIHVISESGTFQDGETLSINSVNVAVLNTSTSIYYPVINVGDPDSPFNVQKVDVHGSSYVRFDDGDPIVDAFGNLLTSNLSIVDQFNFIYGDIEGKYTDITGSGGTVTPLPSESTFRLSTTTTSGSYASRTTNQYYPYIPGVGSMVMMTVLIGDTGKTGVTRRWGLFDDDDGVYFELSGSVFSVNIKSSNSGSPTIEKVIQSDFAGDKASDDSLDEYVLDVSKFNLYWIDYQWLGVGRIRFGTFSPSGVRLVLHSVENSNKNVLPYMKRGTLPFRMEQFNETTVVSTSEMKLGCVSVSLQQSHQKYIGYKFLGISNFVQISGSEYTPILSLKNMTPFNGQTNRITTFITECESFISGGSAIISSFKNPNLTGSTFTGITQSNCSNLIDVDAYNLSNGNQLDAYIINDGNSSHKFEEDIRTSFATLSNGDPSILTFAAKPIIPNTTCSIQLIVKWKESH